MGARLVLALVVLAGACTSAGAATYVDIGSRGGACSDTRTASEASSPVTPWCSLGRAASAAPDGSEVQVRQGTYPRLVTSATHAARVTFRPRAGEAVRLQGMQLTSARHLAFEGFEITPEGVMLRGSSDIVLEGNNIHDIRRDTSSCPTAPNVGNGYAIWLVGSNGRGARNTIRGNRIAAVTHDAIQTGSNDDLLIEDNEITAVRSVGCGDHSDAVQIVEGRRIVVRSNHVHHNVHGFMVNGHGSTFRGDLRLENNLIHDISGGIALNLYNVDGLALHSNTVWHTGTTAVRVRDTTENPTVMRATVRNNIFEEFDSQCDSTGCITAQERNLFGSSSDRRTSDLASASPGFGVAYELAPGSAAINAGTTTDAPTVDRLGRTRDAQRDVGAHEAGSAAPPTESDGDGVADSSDACPALSGPAPTGCPLPVASFTINPNPALSGQQVTFDGTASVCHPGPCRYAWRETPSWPFGTGQAIERFTFRSVKDHPIQLTVTDGLGRSASRSQVLTVR
jgi:Right handed beta helix region